MHNEFTAVFERDADWFVAYCPEIHGANGQGRTNEDARESLAAAITLILADRRDGLRAVPPEGQLSLPVDKPTEGFDRRQRRLRHSGRSR